MRSASRATPLRQSTTVPNVSKTSALTLAIGEIWAAAEDSRAPALKAAASAPLPLITPRRDIFVMLASHRKCPSDSVYIPLAASRQMPLSGLGLEVPCSPAGNEVRYYTAQCAVF